VGKNPIKSQIKMLGIMAWESIFQKDHGNLGIEEVKSLLNHSLSVMGKPEMTDTNFVERFKVYESKDGTNDGKMNKENFSELLWSYVYKVPESIVLETKIHI